MAHGYVESLIRTWVPVAVGAVLTWLATKVGIVLDEQSSVMAVTVSAALVTAAYYAVSRAVEQRWPAVGRVLVSLGIARQAPVYGVEQPHRTPQR
jgi:hypothetical protein